MSETHRLIADHLRDEYRITDYKKGYATDIKGKQLFKIGKLLKNDDGLYKCFMRDSVRMLDNITIVISRNPDDIAHMSTGRAWSSCMGSNGCFYRYVPEDIKHGTLIAYMISEKDPDIHSPLARILIKPFRREISLMTRVANFYFGREAPQEHIFVADKTYGIHNDFFEGVVKQFIEETLNQGKTGKFQIVPGLYRDGTAARQKRKNEKTEAIHF